MVEAGLRARFFFALFGVWDAIILAAAADAHARLLLSEDLQDGFTWSGVTVANPFAGKRHPLLEAILTR